MNENVKECRIQKNTPSLLDYSNDNSQEKIRNKNFCTEGINQKLLSYFLWNTSKWALRKSISVLNFDLGKGELHTEGVIYLCHLSVQDMKCEPQTVTGCVFYYSASHQVMHVQGWK
jgi:hypothetical protein